MKNLNKEIPLHIYFRTRFWVYLFNLTPNHSVFDSLRNRFLKLAGFVITDKIKAFSPISISPKTNPKNITFRGFVFINSGARFSAPKNTKITINRGTLIGPNVTFETVNHGLIYSEDKPRGAILGDIELKEGVWVGTKSIILQNVTIGFGSVIAASSVVTKSIGDRVVAGGIPAKVIKKINE